MIHCVKKEVSPSFSITERSVPELIPDLGSQPAGDVNYKPDGRLPLLSARPAVTPPQPLRGLLPIIGADSTGATGNVAPVLTQEPRQKRCVLPRYLSWLCSDFLSERCSSTC